MTQLSEHFTLEEFTYSETAESCGIDNTPDDAVIANLTRLAGVMEEVRRICVDYPVTVTSGYRCLALNEAIGGATESAHLHGLGCDFIIPDYGSPHDVCLAIEPYIDVLGVDQLIWEYGDWVHLGLSEGEPRCQCLTIDELGTSEGFV